MHDFKFDAILAILIKRISFFQLCIGRHRPGGPGRLPRRQVQERARWEIDVKMGFRTSVNLIKPLTYRICDTAK